MANLMSDFYSEGPYLHTKAYHFRQDVHTQISNTSWSDNKIVDDIRVTVEQLIQMSRDLQVQADRFLSPWGGSYKEASLDLFGNHQGGLESQYRKRLNSILNSSWFINTIERYATVEIDEQALKEGLTSHGFKLTQKMLKTNIQTEKQLEAFVEDLVTRLIKQSKSGSSNRIYVTGIENILEGLLGEVNQQYFKDKASLSKQITKSILKKSKKVEWKRIYEEVRSEFLLHFPNDTSAMTYIDTLENQFIAQGRKLKHIDYANVAGFILENLMTVTVNNSSLEIKVYDVGESTEAEIVEFANDFAKSMDIKSKQITTMKTGANSAVQSGSDWIIVNSNGAMVRAQAKNSTQLAEEFEREGRVNRPQPLKVQGSIKYSTLKDNLKSYSKGTGLTDEDWLFLDYLIANILWIRAGGAVTKDKGGSYSSGVSGIQDLINRLLTKEIGYFLGVTLDVDDQVNSIKTVIGGSNIFFVIDGLVLYPTYKLIDNIIKQLRAIEDSVAKLYFSLGQNFHNPTALMEAKEKAKKENPNWQYGDPYGAAVLEKGREAGNLITGSLQIKGVNLNIDINTILSTIYDTILE